MMGFSTLLCQLAIALIQYFSASHNNPKNLEHWLTVARGGWMRHHFHTLEVLPISIAIIFIILQITSEELVFRGIFLKFYLPHGKLIAISISTFLFVIMQKFFMPTKISAMFPMIGALVMGIVNGILYTKIPLLTPLIISHLVFFIFAVL